MADLTGKWELVSWERHDSGTVPLDSPTSSYSFDGEREGVGHAPTALADTTCT